MIFGETCLRYPRILHSWALAGLALGALAIQPAPAAEQPQNPEGRESLLPLTSLTGDRAFDTLMERREVHLGSMMVRSGKIRSDQQDGLLFGALVGSEFGLTGGEVQRCRDVEVTAGLTNQGVDKVSGVACRGRMAPGRCTRA